MTEKRNLKYKFGSFEFDPSRLSLYYKGEYVEVEPNPLRVLSLLVEKANNVVLHDELIERAWGDNHYGVLPTNVAQSVKKLREALASVEPTIDVIRTARGRGYYFHGDIEKVDQTNDDSKGEPNKNVSEAAFTNTSNRVLTRVAFLPIGIGILLIGLLVFVTVSMSSNDEQKIRETLVASQNYEVSQFYADPEEAEIAVLDKYWVSEDIYGLEADIRKVKAGLDKLKRERRKYGTESRATQFEIQSVEISSDGKFATARTLEKWLLAIYSWDGVLLENRTVGPYFVYYTLRKIDGNWKIGRSSTGRTAKTPPVLQMVELVSKDDNDVSGYSIDLTGANFDIGSLNLTFVGPNCPAENPCTIDNMNLRANAEVSFTSVKRLRINLKPGEYDVFVRNAESTPSNSIKLNVP